MPSKTPFMDKYYLKFKDLKNDNFEILDTYLRLDYQCFTQGLYYDTKINKLVESCGQYRHSKTQVLDLGSDHILRPAQYEPFKSAFFAEGLTLKNDTHYIALTWKENTFVVIDRETFKVTEERPYPKGYKEGWGITHSDKFLFATDGSNILYQLDRESL